MQIELLEEKKVTSYEIAHLRERIDAIDADVLKLLAFRMKRVEELSVLKQKENMAVVQSNRWQKVQSRLSEMATELDLDSEWILRLYDCIHKEAIRRQETLISNSKSKAALEREVR